MKLLQLSLVLTLVFLGAASFSQAATIGISHVGPGDGQSGSDGTVSPVTLVAGVVPQSNWNNIEDARGEANDLVDSDGNATTADVEWFSLLGPWDTGGPKDSGDEQLLHGYLDGDHRGATLVVSNLPPEFTTLGYDLYVYHESQGGDGRIGFFSIDDTPFSYNNIVWAKDIDGTFGKDGLGYVENGYASQEEAEAGTGGNYVVYRGLRGDSFGLKATGVTDGTPRLPIQGIQIVPIPEPGTLLLAATGLIALGLLSWRRRKA